MKLFLLEIASEAKNHSLPYLIIGGHAVILWGVPRFTKDVDLLIIEKDITMWIRLMERLGLQLLNRTAAFAQFVCRGDGDIPPVDIMVVDEKTWNNLINNACVKNIGMGSEVKVPCVKHLIAMKIHSLKSPFRRAGNSDLPDIINLMKIGNIAWQDPEFKAIVKRYGSQEIMDNIKKEFEHEHGV